MKLAIMQPYIFPYLGYFQLVNAVELFVFYDDVNFIKRGWVNRNRIIVNGKDFMFTVPLVKASQNNSIKESYINKESYDDWKKKFLLTIEHSYKKAPQFESINSLVMKALNKEHNSVSDLAIDSIKSVSEYLGIKTKFITSSDKYQNKNLERQERLIDICKIEGADYYINALGGQELYVKGDFSKQNIKLDFIKPILGEYKQFDHKFVPGLSIIDALMFNSKKEIKKMLSDYQLV